MSPRAQLDELTIRCLWTRVTGLHTLWTARSRCHHRVDDVRLGCAVTSVRLLCSGVGVTSVCVCVCVCVWCTIVVSVCCVQYIVVLVLVLLAEIALIIFATLFPTTVR